MRLIAAAFASLCLILGLSACSTQPGSTTTTVTYAQVVAAVQTGYTVLRAGAEDYIARHPEDVQKATLIRQSEQIADGVIAQMQAIPAPTIPTTPQEAAREAQTAIHAIEAALPAGTLPATVTDALGVTDVMLSTYLALNPEQAASVAAAHTRMTVVLPKTALR